MGLVIHIMLLLLWLRFIRMEAIISHGIKHWEPWHEVTLMQILSVFSRNTPYLSALNLWEMLFHLIEVRESHFVKIKHIQTAIVFLQHQFKICISKEYLCLELNRPFFHYKYSTNFIFLFVNLILAIMHWHEKVFAGINPALRSTFKIFLQN